MPFSSPETFSSQGTRSFARTKRDSDQWPLFLSRQGWGDRALTSSLCLPEDKADPGHREISATRCPKALGRVLVHTSVSPSPDNLRRFALEREASEQVDIYLWKLVKGEHWRPPSCEYLGSVPFPGLQGPLRALWASFVDPVPLAQGDLPMAGLPGLSP